MRRKAREWGVFYESNIAHTINALVKDAESLLPLEAVNVEIVETGLLRTTLANGTVSLETKASDEVTVRYSLSGYVTQNVVVTFVDGQAVYSLTVMLVHV